jgi:hypothetical protein
MPNLIRDEWVNVGILLFDPASGRVLRRLVEEPAEMARVRRLHPAADEALLRGLPEEFDAQIGAPGRTPAEQLSRLEETLSNAVQLSPRKGLLAEDFDAELDRLYRDHVEPRAAAISRTSRRETPSARAPIKSFAARVSGRAWSGG